MTPQLFNLQRATRRFRRLVRAHRAERDAELLDRLVDSFTGKIRLRDREAVRAAINDTYAPATRGGYPRGPAGLDVSRPDDTVSPVSLSFSCGAAE